MKMIYYSSKISLHCSKILGQLNNFFDNLILINFSIENLNKKMFDSTQIIFRK